MSDRLLHGEPASDEQIQAWADVAERGYDLTAVVPPRPGRPSVGNGPGVAIMERSDVHPLDALTQRATPEEE